MNRISRMIAGGCRIFLLCICLFSFCPGVMGALRKHPGVPQIKGLKVDNTCGWRSLKISWKPVPGADGYIVRYSQNEDMAKSRVKKVRQLSSCRLEGLDVRCVYYVSVRAYRREGVHTFIGRESAVRHKKVRGRLVVIDPGHQAHANLDLEPNGPGSEIMKAKVSGGTAGVVSKVRESVLALNVSLLLRDELEARGYQVVMTRTVEEVDISNMERALLANECGADAFLRIHANGSKKKAARGMWTLCPSPENPYPVRELYEKCRRLSEMILESAVSATGAKPCGVQERDNLTGINWSEVPVCLLEMGYMTNPEEDRLMQTPDYQEKIVRGTADGLDRYFSRKK